VTKKRSSEILADENRKIWENFPRSLKFFFWGERGKSETGWKCIIASEGLDAPGLWWSRIHTYYDVDLLQTFYKTIAKPCDVWCE